MYAIELINNIIEWLTLWTSDLRIASCMGSNPVRDKPLFDLVSLSKRLYTHCSVLVGSRNRFESVSI